VVPIVGVIADPTIGPGALLGPILASPPDDWSVEDESAAFDAGRRLTPLSTTVAFGLYTANETWAAGVGHFGVWGQDTWRYNGFLGGGRFNLTVASDDASDPTLFAYRLEGWLVDQSIQRRLGGSDLWVGAHYQLMDAKSVYIGVVPDGEAALSEGTLSALGLSLMFDNRNTIFTPDNGVRGHLRVDKTGGALGGDFEYWEAEGDFVGYWGVSEAIVVGARLEAETTQKATPFWARPAVALRGISANRYMGDVAGTAEGEVRWDLDYRWSAIGFGGAGWTLTDRTLSDRTRVVGAGGAGFRYLLARAIGLRAGIDLAYGTDGFAYYVTIGSAWLSI